MDASTAYPTETSLDIGLMTLTIILEHCWYVSWSEYVQLGLPVDNVSFVLNICFACKTMSFYIFSPDQVPTSFLNKCTPAMRQWWVLKSENYDTILFFKASYEDHPVQANLCFS